MHAIGKENGTLLRSVGSHAVRSTTAPKMVIRIMYMFMDLWISAVLPINLQRFQHARKSPHRMILRTHGAISTLDEENQCLRQHVPQNS